MSDDLDAALDVLRSELLGKMDDGRDVLADIIFKTLQIVASQEETLGSLRAVILNEMQGKRSEALELLRADHKTATARLTDVVSLLKMFSSSRYGS